MSIKVSTEQTSRGNLWVTVKFTGSESESGHVRRAAGAAARVWAARQGCKAKLVTVTTSGHSPGDPVVSHMQYTSRFLYGRR